VRKGVLSLRLELRYSPSLTFFLIPQLAGCILLLKIYF